MFSSNRNIQSNCVEKPQLKIISFKNYYKKHGFIINNWSKKNLSIPLWIRGPVQTSDQQTSDVKNLRLTNVGQVLTSDWY